MDLVGLLEVLAVERPTPRLRRVMFAAPAGFVTWPDQQLKLYFPREGQDVPSLPPSEGDDMRWYQAFLAIPEPERPWMRSFTVRGYDPVRGVLEVDFVLHGSDGPAAGWAARAERGQVIGRYGPSAAYRRALTPAPEYLLVGDEAAIPAIGSLLASLPPTAKAVAVLEIHDAREEQDLSSAATVDVHWLHRDGRGPGGDLLLDRVAELPLPAGSVAWLAGEAGVVRSLRRHLVDRGVPKHRIEFTGYWRKALTQDDSPTTEDLAEARERVAAARPDS